MSAGRLAEEHNSLALDAVALPKSEPTVVNILYVCIGRYVTLCVYVCD